MGRGSPKEQTKPNKPQEPCLGRWPGISGKETEIVQASCPGPRFGKEAASNACVSGPPQEPSAASLPPPWERR